MKNQAFTLIELLVVVLIIGILAAIAVPQYQKAVLKSRFSTLKNMTRSLWEAEKAYYLANNTYAGFINDLDISLPKPNFTYKNSSDSADTEKYYYDNFYCDIYYHKTGGNVQITCYLTKNNNAKLLMSYGYIIYINNNHSQRVCRAFSPSGDIYNYLCSAETGVEGPSDDFYNQNGYKFYIYD